MAIMPKIVIEGDVKCDAHNRYTKLVSDDASAFSLLFLAMKKERPIIDHLARCAWRRAIGHMIREFSGNPYPVNIDRDPESRIRDSLFGDNNNSSFHLLSKLKAVSIERPITNKTGSRAVGFWDAHVTLSWDLRYSAGGCTYCSGGFYYTQGIGFEFKTNPGNPMAALRQVKNYRQMMQVDEAYGDAQFAVIACPDIELREVVEGEHVWVIGDTISDLESTIKETQHAHPNGHGVRVPLWDEGMATGTRSFFGGHLA